MITHITRPSVPVEALRINEDICSLTSAIRILQTVDPYNITAEPDRDDLWMMLQKLKLMKNYAEQKLRSEYLAPVKRRVR